MFCIDVTPTDDNIVENSEEYVLLLAISDGAVEEFGAPNITIIDNDSKESLHYYCYSFVLKTIAGMLG